MYDQNQLRRDASQLEIDLHDLARHVELILAGRYDISREIRQCADQVTPAIRKIQNLTSSQASK